MDQSEIEALIQLIDDEDPEVFANVNEKLKEVGSEAYALIRERMLRSENELQHLRLKTLLQELNLDKTKKDLLDWAENRQHDLLEGYFLIARYRYPELELAPIDQYIDKMKLDIWLRLNRKFSPIDNVRVINEVFFGKYRFHGDKNNYFAPDNSYLNLVIEQRKGNPISLSILYSVIAQRLFLPIFGVNLPQHFILAYKDDQELEEHESFDSDGYIPYNIGGETLFYVNAFNGGAIFSRYNIDRFLDQSKLPSEEAFYEPCPNLEIIKRVIRNLIYSYEKLGDHNRMQQLRELHDSFE